jgi:hypothetical protein
MPKSVGPSDPIAAVRPIYEKLLEVRASKTVSLKPSPILRTEIRGLDGRPEPFRLRYYQSQGVYHLLMMPRMVLGDGTGLGKCVTGDTMLVTNRGMIPIRELAPEGELRDDTFYEPRIQVMVRTGDRDMAKVGRFYWCGQKETRKVTTRNGFQIEGSLVHPVLVRGPSGIEEMRRLPDLRVGQDYICIDRGEDCFPAHEPIIPFDSTGPDVRTYDFPIGMTSNLARLLGYVTAGDRTSSEAILSFTGGIERPAIEFLEVCGVSNDRRVPWVVLRATKPSVREFLRGLFEGGALVTDGGIEFRDRSEKLLRTVQLLLLKFGIVSSLRSVGQTHWRLSISGEAARVFDREVGFVTRGPVHAEPTDDTDTVPYMRQPVTALAEAVRGHIGENFRVMFEDVAQGRCDPTYRFLQQLLNVSSAHGLQGHASFQEIQSVVRRHYFYDPVVSIDVGFASLMDVEVCHPGHQFSGNGFVNHNTVETIAALCYLWSTKEPDNRVIIVAPKSAIPQWADEIRRFTIGVEPIVAVGSMEARRRAYDKFVEPGGHKVLLLNYQTLCRDWVQGRVRPLLPNGRPDPKQPVTPGLLDKLTKDIEKDLVVVYDECTAFKNMRTKTWEVCRFLADRSKRVYGLTATLLKNNLMEGFSIFKCIRPEVFTTKQSFLDTYCVTKMQPTRNGLKIPIVVGYRNLDLFRSRIDPFFLGRPKHAVSDELPVLTTREVRFMLAPLEDYKYREALAGILELGDGEIREYEEHKALVSLTYCQQVVNSLFLLRFQDGDDGFGGVASKEQELLDLVGDELDGEKVIVYTRFESHVARLQGLLAKVGVESVRITGKEKEDGRRRAQQAFQDPGSSVRVVFITDAGSEAINLQAAGAMVFYDAPWSWGNYTQIIGRMIRIGSPHRGVLVYHLISERPGKDPVTIDGHVLSMLRRKKSLIDRVIGEAAIGALEFDGHATKDLLRRMQGKSDD